MSQLTAYLPYELDMIDEATAYLQSNEFAKSFKVTSSLPSLVPEKRRNRCLLDTRSQCH